MTRPNPVSKVRWKKTFSDDYKSLPDNIKERVRQALRALVQNPRPASIRFEKLRGFRNPSVYTIHVTPNHSHKLSFELDGDTAVLRRVGSHKQIDRRP